MSNVINVIMVHKKGALKMPKEEKLERCDAVGFVDGGGVRVLRNRSWSRKRNIFS